MLSIWEKIHETLQGALEREISLRQEILSNLSQQEYALLIGDVWVRESLNRGGSRLVCNLRMLIKIRSGLTRQLIAISPSLTGSDSKLDQMLDPTQEIEGETYLLYQNLCALVTKIRHKHLHIKILLATPQGREEYSPTNYFTLPIDPPHKLKRRPTSLTTLERPKGYAK